MLPVQKEYAERVYWMYTVLLPKCSAETRDAVREILASQRGGNPTGLLSDASAPSLRRRLDTLSQGNRMRSTRNDSTDA